MSLKLKALGLGILATLAMSAVAAMNASALSNGHFTSDVALTTLVGSEVPGTKHQTELTAHGLEGGVVCDEATYHATTSALTVNAIRVKATYHNCHTTPSEPTTTTVTMNKCEYEFTSGGTGTVHIVGCEAGKGIEVHHPNCTITIMPQTVSGVKYETDTDTTANGTKHHIITLDANTVQFATQYHGGICIFTGTNHTGTLHGSVTVRGFAHGTNNQVNITAT